jgi:hypothetical protein
VRAPCTAWEYTAPTGAIVLTRPAAPPLPIHLPPPTPTAPDTSKAAADADELLSSSSTSRPGGVLALLERRWTLAVHTFAIAPPPALLANAAIFTVEEGVLVWAFLQRRRRLAEAERVLADPRSTMAQRREAARVIVSADGPASGGGGASSGGDVDKGGPTGSGPSSRSGGGGGGGSSARGASRLVYESLDLAVRCGSSVVLESVCCAVGTFLWPGHGTWLLGALGSTLAWLV